MGDKTTKTVKVPTSKAEEWDRYADENPEVDSVSHLIRLSVEKEMSGEYDTRARRSGDTGDAALSGEVLTALRGMQTTLEDVEERLSAIEDIDRAEANYDLQRASFNLLPTPPDGKQATSDYHKWAATAEDVAQQLGAEPADVEETLDKLRETTGQVQAVSGGPDNNTYYWRRD